jgi:hypothetical protein
MIGCVYIYPDNKGEDDAVVTSWVRATHAGRDVALREIWIAMARRGVAIRADRIRGSDVGVQDNCRAPA